MISMNKKSSLRIGRGHESDIRIPDISVSRFHALISFQNSNFYLEDNTSKFGTLIELSGETPVTQEMLL
jgi:pSer/pThr/pTyr-binding forkhead associated (FHA) protein